MRVNGRDQQLQFSIFYSLHALYCGTNMMLNRLAQSTTNSSQVAKRRLLSSTVSPLQNLYSNQLSLRSLHSFTRLASSMPESAQHENSMFKQQHSIRAFSKKTTTSALVSQSKVDKVELQSQQLQRDLADKIKTDGYSGNLHQYMRTLNFHHQSIEQNSPAMSATQQREEYEAIKEFSALEKQKDTFLRTWIRKVWPERLTPELVKEWQVLENRAALDMNQQSINQQTTNKKNAILQARGELKYRDRRRERSLNEPNIGALIEASVVEQWADLRELETAIDDPKFGQDAFQRIWGKMLQTKKGSKQLKDDDKVALKSLEGVDPEFIRETVDEWLGDGKLSVKSSLSIMHDLDSIDPLVFKQIQHFTAEDQEVVLAYERRQQTRRATIAQRGNFFELQRNQDLWSNRDQFNKLIVKAIQKTSEKELPPEFSEWVKYVQTYEKKNPGKYYLAIKYGQAIEGVMSKDLMASSDYETIFGKDGQMPEMLQKAYANYSDRLSNETAERSPQIQNLMKYLNKSKTSKKQMSKTEVDQIVELIKEMDLEATKRVDSEVVRQEAGQNSMDRIQRKAMNQIIEESNEMLASRSKQMLKKQKTKMTQKQFDEHSKKAFAYLNAQDKGFSKLMKKLDLEKSNAFNALITDIFVNSSQEVDGKTSCLLLDRFGSLLSMLSGKQANLESSVNELYQTFEVGQVSPDREHIYRELAQNNEFMLKFTVMQIAKQHNLYGQIDDYMRKFARVCVNVDDGGDIAKRLEGVLNSEIAIADPKVSKRAFTPTYTDDAAMEDYQTVDPNIIAQPDFPYLPAGLKIARIEEYHRLNRELEKTKEVRKALEGAEDSDLQRHLMKSQKELDSIIEHLDADPKTTKEHGKFGDLWFMSRQKKIAGSIDGLVAKLARENYGQDGIDMENVEQMFNPYVSGVYSISEQTDRLVSAGLSVDMADTLGRQYLSTIARESSVHTLMDLFQDEKAKKALHNLLVDMKQIVLNYQSTTPRSAQTANKSLAERAMASVQRIAPIRPRMGSMQARAFSSSVQTDDSDAESEPTSSKGRFFKFLEKADTIDKKIEKDPELAKMVGSAESDQQVEIMFDADEIEISFADAATEKAIDDELADIDPIAQAAKSIEKQKADALSMKDQKLYELIQKAKKRFDIKFFQNFAYEGPLASKLSQRDLEAKMLELSAEDQELLILSMINSAYELNDIIPNVEMVFYRMFVSPVSTYAERKQKDGEDLLAGNLFHDLDGFKMPKQAYVSLLQSVALNPKKKHFKKILQYLVLNESSQELSADLIDLVTFIGIDQKYPVLLGSTMKYLIQNDYQVKTSTLQQFVMFLERCKGYEEDAKRFLFMSSETSDIQLDYKMVRPMFQRVMQYKSAQDVLKLFEQFRKNLKLNKSTKSWDSKVKHQKLQDLRKDFYDGLIRDLLQREAYQLSQIIYGEKKREKFEVTISDQMIGFEIFSAQKKMEEYKDIFNEVNRADSKFTMDKSIAEEIGRTLLKFTADEYQTDVLDMCDSLQFKILENQIPISSKLFDSLATQYTETQSWSKVLGLISSCTIQNCDPQPRIISYLKKNLVYCFDTNVRAQLKDNIDQFEQRFFSVAGREQRRQERDNQKAREQILKKTEKTEEPIIDAKTQPAAAQQSM